MQNVNHALGMRILCRHNFEQNRLFKTTEHNASIIACFGLYWKQNGACAAYTTCQWTKWPTAT